MAAQHSDMKQSLGWSNEVTDMYFEYMAMGMGGKLSDWAAALWSGDVDSVKKMLEDLGEDELKQQLEERETNMKITAIQHVMHGAARSIPDQVLQSCLPAVRCRDHKKVLDMLILLGADVNARDRAGCTPLYYVAASNLAAAEALLIAGADPNARSRSGSVPLLSYVMVEQADLDMVRLLVKYGADQNIRINGIHGYREEWTGMSVREVVEKMEGRERREILKILDKAPVSLDNPVSSSEEENDEQQQQVLSAPISPANTNSELTPECILLHTREASKYKTSIEVPSSNMLSSLATALPYQPTSVIQPATDLTSFSDKTKPCLPEGKPVFLGSVSYVRGDGRLVMDESFKDPFRYSDPHGSSLTSAELGDKFRKMVLKKQKRFDKQEKNVLNVFKTADKAEEDLDTILQNLGENVVETKVKVKKTRRKIEKPKSENGEISPIVGKKSLSELEKPNNPLAASTSTHFTSVPASLLDSIEASPAPLLRRRPAPSAGPPTGELHNTNAPLARGAPQACPLLARSPLRAIPLLPRTPPLARPSPKARPPSQAGPSPKARPPSQAITPPQASGPPMASPRQVPAAPLSCNSSLIPECPVCLEDLKPPLKIFNCENGHLICSTCRKRVKKCHCLAVYMGRATAMEQIVRQILGIM